MDELLAAAAAALGTPEEMVLRSARARAQADGMAVEDVLAAWGGSGPTLAPAVPAADPAPAPPTEPSEPTEEEAPESSPAATADPVPMTPTAPSPAPATDAPAVSIADAPAPVLTGRRDSTWSLLAGVAALFISAVVFTVAAPAISAERGDTIAISAGAVVYQSEGCWYCHTQQVRPIITDVFLGPVTHPERIDSRTFLGVQRIGPDLSTAGEREPTDSAEWLEEFLLRPASVNETSIHPSYTYLSDADLAQLIAYLISLRS